MLTNPTTIPPIAAARGSRRCRARRRAFTLLEMVLAASICAVVMAGMFSAVLLAGRASTATAQQPAVDMHGLLERFRADAAVATAITQLTSTAVGMTVPDRNGDGLPETIVYDTSLATATNKFVSRTYNGVTELIAIGSGSTFSVASDIDQSTTSDVSESAEQLMFTHSTSVPLAYSIKQNQWTGQFVAPALPTSATSWRVTRVRFPARYKNSANGTTRVQVRLPSNGLPTTIVDEAPMLESSLGASYSTQEITFTKASGLPTTGACIVWQWAKDPEACDVQYELLSIAPGNGQRVTCTDSSGASWSASSLQAMTLDVYGTYTVPAGVTIRKLRSLTVTVKADPTLAAPITTTIRFPNLPLVSG